MNPSTKVFAILSLSATCGTIIAKAGKDDTAKWRGQKLYEAGFEAAQKYPFPQLNDNKMRQIEKSIEKVCKADQEFELIETLSFLLCGLNDIWSHVNPDNQALLESLFKRIPWVLRLFDPGLDLHDVYNHGHERYEGWAA